MIYVVEVYTWIFLLSFVRFGALSSFTYDIILSFIYVEIS